MPKSPATVTSVPYGKCISCEKIGVSCIGPPLSSMEIHDQSDWCRLRKDYLHTKDRKWTNNYIAEQIGVSVTTVNRFLGGTVEDAKISTVTNIFRMLVGGNQGQYSCDTHSTELQERATKAEAELARLKIAHEEDRKKIDFLKKQVEFKEQQMNAKDQIIQDRYGFLARKDRVIRILAILLGVAVFVIIAALLADKTNPNIGFLWLH